jgi:hypothetical protein
MNNSKKLRLLEIAQSIVDFLPEDIRGDISDGYHSFNELYQFRLVLTALLFNKWADEGLIEVYKSKKHFDGKPCFGGKWFIIVANLPTGQVSFHYELKDWNAFSCVQYDKSKDPWDGHTAMVALKRLMDFIRYYDE